MTHRKNKNDESTRKPRYAFLTAWELDGQGGVNQVVLNLMRQIRLSGEFQPLSIVHDWQTKWPRIGRRGHRATLWARHRMPWGPGAPFKSALLFLLTLPWNLFYTLWLLRHLNIRVVNIHYPNLAAINYVLLRRLRLYSGKVLISLHGRDVRDSANVGGFERNLWKWMLRNADRIVACSQGLADDALSAYPEIQGHLCVVHNGVDIEHLRKIPIVATPVPPGSGPLLVNLATYEHKKGQDILLRAFARVIEVIPTARLAIAGRTGDLAVVNKLEQQLEELGLQGNAQLYRDLTHTQAISLLNQCDLFVLPSRNEGFAIALLEAGGLGKPVVAMNICGVAELVVNGEEGIIVPPEDVEALSVAICGELMQLPQAQQRAASLQRKVETHFTWPRAWREYLNLVDSSASPSGLATHTALPNHHPEPTATRSNK